MLVYQRVQNFHEFPEGSERPEILTHWFQITNRPIGSSMAPACSSTASKVSSVELMAFTWAERSRRNGSKTVVMECDAHVYMELKNGYIYIYIHIL